MREPIETIRHRAHRASLAQVREITSHTFTTSAGAAFCLVNGMLVGASKHGRYCVALSEILSVYARVADSQQRKQVLALFGADGGAEEG